MNNLPRVVSSRARPGIELATSWSQVRRPTVAPPRHLSPYVWRSELVLLSVPVVSVRCCCRSELRQDVLAPSPLTHSCLQRGGGEVWCRRVRCGGCGGVCVVCRVQQDVLAPREPQDSPAIAHRRAALPLPAARLWPRLQQLIGPCQAPPHAHGDGQYWNCSSWIRPDEVFRICDKPQRLSVFLFKTVYLFTYVFIYFSKRIHNTTS